MSYRGFNLIIFIWLIVLASCTTPKNSTTVMPENNSSNPDMSRPAKPLGPFFSAYSPKGEWMVTIEFAGDLSFEHTLKGIKFSVAAPQPVAVSPNGLRYSVMLENGDQFSLTIYETPCGKTEWGREAKLEGVYKGEKMEKIICGSYLERQKEKKSSLWFVEEVNQIKSADVFQGEEVPRAEFHIEGGMVNGIFGCRRFMGSFDDVTSVLTISFLQAPNMNCHEGPKTSEFLVSIENKGFAVEEKDNRLFLRSGNLSYVLHKMD